MPLVTSNQRYFLDKYFPPLLWGVWIVFLIVIIYLTRYWINHDAFGSLDSARYFQNFQLKEAFNAYWGVGYALLLSFLPLDNATSWLQVHLLIGLLVLISQLLIYKVLLNLNVRKSLATILCIIWGATNFSTGGGLFITADVPLCFMGSLFLFTAIKSDKEGKLNKPGNAALLGTLHGVAWITKTVALPGLMLFPGLIFLRGVLEDNGLDKRLKFLGGIKFLAAYFFPLIIIMAFWATGSYSKYGRVTFSESSSYNYALYIEKSDQLKKGKEKARENLPPYGTYFWSDIGASLTGWDHKINFNFDKQLDRAWFTIKYFFVSENIRDGCVIMFLFLFSIPPFICLFSKWKEYYLVITFTAVGFFLLMIYASVLLLSRYLVFPAVFFMPICGVFLEHLVQKRNTILKAIIFAVLLFSMVHGFTSMIYTSIFMAPGGEHFSLVRTLKTTDNSGKSAGPIGAFLGSHDFLHHHAVIGYLLKVQAAEIRPEGTYPGHFTATFDPNTVLLAVSPQEQAPAAITVNNREYKKLYVAIWGKSSKRTQLAIYRKQ